MHFSLLESPRSQGMSASNATDRYQNLQVQAAGTDRHGWDGARLQSL